MNTQFSAFTSDLKRSPDLFEAMKHEAAKHGSVVITTDGAITTVSAEAL
jgi:hypothetical protein